MRSIGSKLTISIILLLLTAAVSLGYFSYLNSSNAVIDQVKMTLTEKTADTSHYIDERFNRSAIELRALASSEEVKSMDDTKQKAFLSNELNYNADYLTFAIIKEDGTSHYLDGTTADLSDRNYVIDAFAGYTTMSDTIISRVTNEPVIMMATPIETINNEPALLLARIDGYYLSNLTDEITIGAQGHAFIVNEEGIILAHKNREWVKEQVNLLDKAQNENKDSAQAKVIGTMLNNNTGIDNYESNNEKQLLGYHNLNNGWKLGVVAYENDMLKSLDQLKKQFFIIAFIVLILGIIIAITTARSVSRPIKAIVDIGQHLANGDFTKTVPERYLKRHDEIGTLSNTLVHITNNMKSMIVSVNDSSKSVDDAADELDLQARNVNGMSHDISTAIQKIEQGSEAQVAMSEESSKLIEDMANGIQNIAEVASSIATSTDYITEKVSDGHVAVRQSVEQMNQIQVGTNKATDIIKQLDKESQEISQISKMISDISEQTNLLALNASIEAARAGDAGKGFAVVATEVRVLSEQTAESASRINTLIEVVQSHTREAVAAAEQGEDNVVKGIDIVATLGDRFGEIIEAIEEVSNEIEEMSAVSEEMAAGSQQVSASIDEMASTAQTASEYVFEVTAATDNQLQTVEEMSTSTSRLNTMVDELRASIDRFKIS